MGVRIMDKGLESLIEAIAKGLREKRDFPGRWCQHFTEDCIEKMREYGNSGYLCEHECEYCNKFKWVVDRAKQYAEKTGISYTQIIEGWERDRAYWFLSYYQDCNQPEIKNGRVRIFETVQDFYSSLEDKGFRCPSCGVETKAPHKCSCGWCSYGLFGTMGKGITVFIKENMAMSEIFMPVAWESDNQKGAEE